jgi:ribosomal protein L7Ae-like RNA K-turn-binding protein
MSATRHTDPAQPDIPSQMPLNYRDRVLLGTAAGGTGASASQPLAVVRADPHQKSRREQKNEQRVALASMDPRERDQYLLYKKRQQRERALQRAAAPVADGITVKRKEKPTTVALSDVMLAHEEKRRLAMERKQREKDGVSHRPASHHKHTAGVASGSVWAKRDTAPTAMSSAAQGQLAHGRRGKEKAERGALHFSKIKRVILAERADMFKRFYDAVSEQERAYCEEGASSEDGEQACEQVPEVTVTRQSVLDEHRALMGEMLAALNDFHACPKTEVQLRRRLLRRFRQLKRRGEKQRYSDFADRMRPPGVRASPAPFLECFAAVDSNAFPFLWQLISATRETGTDVSQPMEWNQHVEDCGNPATEPPADGQEAQADTFIDDVETTKIINALTFYPPATAYGLGVHPCNPVLDKRARAAEFIANGTHVPIRDYVHHMLTDAIDDAATQMLTDLHRLQRKLKQTQPLRFKALQRYVAGLRETHRAVRLGKARLCIFAPDVEPISSEGGTDDQIGKISALCAAQRVPVVFCLNRKRLGNVLWNRTGSSAVAVVSAEGAHEKLKALVQASRDARREYEEAGLLARETE